MVVEFFPFLLHPGQVFLLDSETPTHEEGTEEIESGFGGGDGLIPLHQGFRDLEIEFGGLEVLSGPDRVEGFLELGILRCERFVC